MAALGFADRLKQLKDAAALKMQGIPDVDLDEDEVMEHPVEAAQPPDVDAVQTAEEADALQSIPQHYFEEECDPVAEIFKKLPQYITREEVALQKKLGTYDLESDNRPLDPDDLERWLDDEWMREQHMLDVVSVKLAENIVSNYQEFVHGMARIHELGTDLQMTGIICRNGRRELARTRSELVAGPLSVLEKSATIERIENLVEILEEIKKLAQMQKSLDEAVATKDFPTAIQLALTFRSTARSYEAYNGVRDLQVKVEATYNVIPDKMLSALKDVAFHFDPVHYEQSLRGFKQLGKTKMVVERLASVYTDAVKKISKRIVKKYILSQKKNKDSKKKMDKSGFEELVTHIVEPDYVACLRSLCRAFCDILINHHLARCWHRNKAAETAGKDDVDRAFYAELSSLLDQSRESVWEEMQDRLSKYLKGNSKRGVDLATFKIEPFLAVLGATKQLIYIGDEFAGRQSTYLRGALKARSQAYFNQFHRTRMEYLRTMLENDVWFLCPVSSKFSALDLKEFRIFTGATPVKTALPSTPTGREESAFFTFTVRPEESVNPFEKILEADEGDEEEGDVEYHEEEAEGPEEGGLGPLLTSTTIKVIRMVGNYLQMMNVLDSISGEVFLGVITIVDYYMYNVYRFFAPSSEAPTDIGMSPRLRSTLAGLKERLDGSAERHDRKMVPLANTNPSLDMRNPNTLFGLAERIVGTESLVFVGDTLACLQLHIKELVPTSHRSHLKSFYGGSGDVIVIRELRDYIYRSSAATFISFDKALASIEKTNFNIKDFGMEHSPYVRDILVAFQQLSLAVKATNENAPAVIVTPEISDVIWDTVVREAMRVLIEGYSRVKKCSKPGRALMSLDMTEIKSGLKNICTIRPLPAVDSVEAYIKAYYLPEEEALPWIRAHQSEYTADQLTRLVTIGPGASMSRRARKELIEVIQQLEKTNRKTVV